MGCGAETEGGAGIETGNTLSAGASGPVRGDAFPVAIEDDSGRRITFQRPPERIVSLVPSVTGILVALGAGERLVARTDFDDDRTLQHLPSVGGGLEPSMERIVSLEPDLVIRFQAESDLITPRRLDQAQIDHVAIRPDGIADVRRIIRLLGLITGDVARADSVDEALTREVSEVAARVAGATSPRVAFLLGGDPPLVAGGGTFLHELIEIAGGINVFADLSLLYAPVSVEEVIRRNVDILLVSEGTAVPRALSAYRIARVPATVELPDLGLGASAGIVARALHPTRFP